MTDSVVERLPPGIRHVLVQCSKEYPNFQHPFLLWATPENLS